MEDRMIKPARPEHEAMRQELVAVLGKYGKDLSPVELLAVCSQLVGQVLAMQDQRTMTPAQGMELIARNIELGNQHAIETLLGGVKGHG